MSLFTFIANLGTRQWNKKKIRKGVKKGKRHYVNKSKSKNFKMFIIIEWKNKLGDGKKELFHLIQLNKDAKEKDSEMRMMNSIDSTLR